MDRPQSDAELNRLLVNQLRSLLQYVGECWPWTAESEAEIRAEIGQLVERQRERSAELAQLLADRGWAIDFGTYPTEYTDLHFVALDFLLAQLVENQNWLTSELESTRDACDGDDPEAAELLGRHLAAHREDVAELEQLVANRSSGQAV